MSTKPVRTAAVNSVIGFLGAAILIPLTLKLGGALVKGVGKGLGKAFVGLFKFSTGRKLIGELVLAGLTALLTNEKVLDKLFGKRKG